MKLKTKFEDEDFRLGEICEASITTERDGVIKVDAPANDGGWHEFYYESLKDMLDKWEDAPEEPKVFWYIDDFMIMCGIEGEFTTPDLGSFTKKDIEKLKEIGNYFETKEEAEKAVRKLQAWHKLMDYWGTEILGWEIRDMPTGGNWQTINVKFNVKTRKEPVELLNILFGGEE